MKIIHTVVSADGFRDVKSNRPRIALLKQLVKLGEHMAANVLVLPAGFLTASTENELPTQIEPIADLADLAHLGIIGGIDVPSLMLSGGKNSDSVDDLVRANRLPYFGFAVGKAFSLPDRVRIWRQSSVTSSNAELVDDNWVPGGERVVTAKETRIGTLICGELFSCYAREKIATAGAELVVDLGHSGMGQGLIPSMRRLAADGTCSVAHSQHLSYSYGRSVHFVDTTGVQHSTPVEEENLVECESLWAGWALREIAPLPGG